MLKISIVHDCNQYFVICWSRKYQEHGLLFVREAGKECIEANCYFCESHDINFVVVVNSDLIYLHIFILIYISLSSEQLEKKCSN